MNSMVDKTSLRRWTFPLISFVATPKPLDVDINDTRTPEELGLSDSIFIASGAVRRAHEAIDYWYSASKSLAELLAAKHSLENAINQTLTRNADTPSTRKERCIAFSTLATIFTSLGDFENAQRIYATIKSMILHSNPSTGNSFEHTSEAANEYKCDILMEYLEFAASTGYDVGFARELAIDLLHAPGTSDWKINTEPDILMTLARINLQQKKSEEALANIKATDLFEDINHAGNTNTVINYSLTRARTYATMKDELTSRYHFRVCLVTSSVLYGLWHPVTLEVLHYLGLALLNWGEYDAAATILSETTHGRSFRLGQEHPLTQDSITALSACTSKETLPSLLGSSPTGFELSHSADLSQAYEHIVLNSVVDLLLLAGETSFATVEEELQRLATQRLNIKTAEHPAIPALRIHRAIARCNFEQNKVEEAVTLLDAAVPGVKRSAASELLCNLDKIMFWSSSESTRSKAIELSKSLFFEVDSKLQPDQAKAFRRRLAALDCTHFTYETSPDQALPIKTLETVGTGAYAAVEKVDICGRLYARKSILLPRYNRKRARETLQNEVAIIRKLEHPHIVRVLCTYEESSRFAIVLEPLATCDLEVYLHRTSKPECAERKSITEKWLECLSGTLSFIHSKGVRHKDIKTRNILVKDGDVLFADFGSSHMFHDEDNSITEGPAYGHTLMYCSPEVVEWQKRGRAADVFSLGCVFTELLTWMGDHTVSDYHLYRTSDVGGSRTHVYHATLDMVDSWFHEIDTKRLPLYTNIIKPMLAKDASARPTAATAHVTIEKLFTNNAMDDIG